MKSLLKKSLPAVGTALLFAALWVEKRQFHTPPDDAAGYHEQVLALTDSVPLHFSGWLGKDAPVPQAAAQLLHPNLMISRQYQNIQTGEGVSFFIVQVRDVRDILGHYPPICYPSRGWAQRSAAAADWKASSSLTVHGTQYVFGSGHAPETEVIVNHVVILPDGQTYRNMDDANGAARDYRRKFFGAAQVQLVFSSGIPAARRQEISESFFAKLQPLIDTIGCKSNTQSQYVFADH